MRCRRPARYRDHRKTDLLAQTLVCHPEGSSSADLRVTVRKLFDPGRMNVVAAADDEILLATDDSQIASVILLPEITAQEPAGGVEGAFRHQLIRIVSEHQRGTAATDLTYFTGAHFHVPV